MELENWKITDLVKWADNPRRPSINGMERLIKQIKRLGQYKPLVVNSGKNWGQRGLIAGGNMRFEALKAMGVTDVYVTLISPETETEFIEYGLSDNDRIGYYDIDLLANLVLPDFELNQYGVDVNPAIDLDYFIHPSAFDPNAEWTGMPEFNQGDKAPIKQIIISFESMEHYEEFAKLINQKLTEKTKSVWYPEHIPLKIDKVYGKGEINE